MIKVSRWRTQAFVWYWQCSIKMDCATPCWSLKQSLFLNSMNGWNFIRPWRYIGGFEYFFYLYKMYWRCFPSNNHGKGAKKASHKAGKIRNGTFNTTCSKHEHLSEYLDHWPGITWVPWSESERINKMDPNQTNWFFCCSEVWTSFSRITETVSNASQWPGQNPTKTQYSSVTLQSSPLF